MLFSQRHRLKPIKTTLQVDSMDGDLRNGLWNCLVVSFLRPLEKDFTHIRLGVTYLDVHGNSVIERLWQDFFKMPIDTIPQEYSRVYEYIRNYHFQGSYYDVYDILEWIAQNHYSGPLSEIFVTECNQTLEKEVSGYRFVADRITRITSDEEITAVEEAMKIPDQFKGPRVQIGTALEKLADRKSPDYRGSIKESISAVEGTVRIIAKKQVNRFRDALSEIEARGKLQLHSALKEAFVKLYGYTSDSKQGIRHALLDDPNLTFEDAKFMLVACSAFINYLIAKVSTGRTARENRDKWKKAKK